MTYDCYCSLLCGLIKRTELTIIILYHGISFVGTFLYPCIPRDTLRVRVRGGKVSLHYLLELEYTLSWAQWSVPAPTESKQLPIITATYSTTVVPTEYEVTSAQLPDQDGARCPQWSWRRTRGPRGHHATRGRLH